jgi:hypothetical protein
MVPRIPLTPDPVSQSTIAKIAAPNHQPVDHAAAGARYSSRLGRNPSTNEESDQRTDDAPNSRPSPNLFANVTWFESRASDRQPKNSQDEECSDGGQHPRQDWTELDPVLYFHDVPGLIHQNLALATTDSRFDPTRVVIHKLLLCSPIATGLAEQIPAEDRITSYSVILASNSVFR